MKLKEKHLNGDFNLNGQYIQNLGKATESQLKAVYEVAPTLFEEPNKKQGRPSKKD